MKRIFTLLLTMHLCIVLFATTLATDTAQVCVARGRLKVCGNNIENYYYDWNGNSYAEDKSQTAFDTRTTKIVNGLLSLGADIYALCEVECGDATLAYLATKMTEKSGNTYLSVDDDTDGLGTTYNKSGFIYRSDKVTTVGNNYAAATSGVYVQRMRIQAFQEISSGEKFTLSMNHFKAFSGQDAARLTNAKSLITALSNSAKVADSDILVMGDLNCDMTEDATKYLVTNGYEELILKWNSSAYSYVYNSNNQLIDHAFANASMSKQVTGAAVYHLNNGGAYGYSDHDPYMVGLNLGNASSSTGTDDTTPCVNLSESYLFTSGFEDWAATTLTGSTSWRQSTSYGVTINAYSANEETEAWMISPAFNLSGMESATFTFNHCAYYVNGDTIANQTLWYSTDYESGEPSTATWTQIPIHFAAAKSWLAYSVDLPASALSSNVHLAFKYTATSNTDANYWEIKSAALESVCSTVGVDIEEPQLLTVNQDPKFFVVDGCLRAVYADITDVRLFTLSGIEVSPQEHLRKGVYVALHKGNAYKIIVRK